MFSSTFNSLSKFYSPTTKMQTQAESSIGQSRERVETRFRYGSQNWTWKMHNPSYHWIRQLNHIETSALRGEGHWNIPVSNRLLWLDGYTSYQPTGVRQNPLRITGCVLFSRWYPQSYKRGNKKLVLSVESCLKKLDSEIFSVNLANRQFMKQIIEWLGITIIKKDRNIRDR